MTPIGRTGGGDMLTPPRPPNKAWRTNIPLISISKWDHEPVPEQEWAVHQRVPACNVTGFYGEGGAGKSTITLQLCIAAVTGKSWMGVEPAQGSALFIDCEDGANVIHQRAANIAQYYDTNFADMDGKLHLVSLFNKDAVLAFYDRRGSRIRPTPLYNHLLEMAGDLKPKIIGLASVADVFAGSELDRGQVRQFVRMLGRIAFVANAGLVLIAHPSLSGISSGTGLSGSTQWHNAVRARFYLQYPKRENGNGEEPESDLRELVYKKSNYGPPVQSVGLQYQNGLFVPLTGPAFDPASKARNVQNVFVEILKRFNKTKRFVGAKQGVNYAPTQFVKEAEAKVARCSKEELAQAMRDLLKDGFVKVEEYGKPSNRHYRLVCVGEQRDMPF
jgi:RecA-family ATPase